MDVRLETLGQDLALAAERGDLPKMLSIAAELRRRDALLRDALPLTVCKNDTNGDGDCGRYGCPLCGKHGLRSALSAFQEPANTEHRRA